MARICMILNNFEPPYGGPELQAQKVAAALIAKGHSIFIIAKGSGQAPAHEFTKDLQITRLNKRGLASVELFFALLKHRCEFDILHVHGVGRLASVAIRFAKYFNKKVFIKVTTAGHIFKKPNSRVKELLQTFFPFQKRKLNLLQQADGVIAISNEIRTELENNGFPINRIYDIPNGVDTSIYHPVDAQVSINLRARLGLPVDKRIFTFTGKLTRRKGIDTLLAAWEKSGLAREKGVLVMLGSGKGHHDGLDLYIQHFVREHQLENSILMIGDVDNVADYLKASDVFVFPSRREGLPNSLLEAMSCGLLCIASNIGGNNELVESGHSGFLVAVEDAEEWRRHIDNAIVNADKELAENAVKMIKDRYDLKITANKLEQLFNENHRGRS